jgi:hypothetical protein
MHEEQLTEALSAVCNQLWQERETLERVLFKLIEQQLILEAGQTRWLAAANDEVEQVSRQLSGTEILRSVEVDSLADLMNLRAGATITELVENAPEPWSGMLAEHRDALRQLAYELDVAIQRNQLLLGAGARAVRETLLSLSDSVATYDARGVPAAVGSHLSRVDAQA